MASSSNAKPSSSIASSSTDPAPTNIEKKIVILKSKDNQTFEVDFDVASMSGTLRMILGDDLRDVIPIPKVESVILKKCIEYCKKHVNDNKNKLMSEELIKWDEKFLGSMNRNYLLHLIMAANYLDIKGLFELIAQTIADEIKDRSVEQVRNYFNIVNDHTDEELAIIRSGNMWAFD